MKQFRRMIALLLAAILLFSGCGQVTKEDVMPVMQAAGELLLELAQEGETTDAPAEDANAPPASEEAQTVDVSEDAEKTDIPERTMPESAPDSEKDTLPEDGTYTAKDEVALYLHLYNHLPDNFITKKQAQKLGWEAGDLWKFAKGKSIGGDRFGNYEGLLPKEKTYKECDIDYTGGKRNGKRIVFSPDGDIYYTGDHYKTFTKLYGGE